MSFLSKIKPHAIASYSKSKILPSIVGAQAILESASGTSDLAVKANNLFGIKGTYNGQSYSKNTQEWSNGKFITVKAAFRKYPSWLESIQDHGGFFTSTPWRTKNYAAVLNADDYVAQARALQSSGYATDPQYANKLINVIKENGLAAWDNEIKGEVTMKINNRINQSLGNKVYDRALSAIKNIIWHYTAVPRSSRAFITGHENHWRNTLGWNRGGYHYYIDADGNIYQNYPLTMMTWGAGWVNPFSVHISVEAANANDYSAAQVQAREWLTRKLMKELKLNANAVLGHKEVGSTACPGYSVSKLNEFRNLLSQSAKVSGGKITTEEVPKKQGKKSNEVVAQEVINGVWGNDPARSNSLRKSGYNPAAIQTIVNRVMNSRKKKSNTPVKRGNTQVAQEVIKGLWGNGNTRQSRLTAAGYNFNAVQQEVNRLLGGDSSAPAKKSIDAVAREVIRGEWGNDPARSKALRQSGYDANAVQRRVNQLL